MRSRTVVIHPSRIDTKPATASRTKAGAVACDITCESCPTSGTKSMSALPVGEVNDVPANRLNLPSHWPRLFFRQMPVLLTRRIGGVIGDIGLYNVSNYATTNIDSATSLISLTK